MIIVEAKIYCKPGKRDEFIKGAQDCITATRQEDGNISYNLYASTENDTDLLYYEQWRDRDALKVHAKSAHMEAWGKKREELGLVAKPSEIKVWDIKEKEPKK